MNKRGVIHTMPEILSDNQKVNIPKGEFDALLARYPSDASLLHSSVQVLGGNAVLQLKDISNAVSEELYDYLHRKTLRLYNRDRFFSYYLQLFETLALPRRRVQKILEVGPGIGLYRTLVESFGYKVTSLDLTADNQPDVVGSVLDIPLADNCADMACAFQVLEHLPFEHFERAISEMLRCSSSYIFISVPCAQSYFYFRFRFKYLQRFFHRCNFDIEKLLPLPGAVADIDTEAFKDRPDKENPHYWELNRKSFPKARIHKVITGLGTEIVKGFHNPYFPYHYFIIARKTRTQA